MCVKILVAGRMFIIGTIMGPMHHYYYHHLDQFIPKTTAKTVLTKGDWCFWPPVQIINFYYLPTHYRVLYINIATMVFNIFMSYMKHYDQKH
ncbi:putative pmp22 peroxisomal membrane protein [Operophtera brumata]|uniref:Putative pmp22 peroxisomal membrane protein n=1 Tax=Operophtera brumata TaxID=104452 RepID=A0A0L7KZH0_OPEBR|nr:putative pmp22 peroxisomal membrane protein [Operophtera brumata]